MRIPKIWLALLLFWLVLAGNMAPGEVLSGTAVSLVLAVWADRFLWRETAASPVSLSQAMRLAAYVPYLAVEIVKAALYVAEKVLDPRLPIDPVIVAVESPLRREVSRVALANSITLTPGTLTVDVEGRFFHVHCLSPEFREGIAERVLERRVAAVFEED